MHEKYTGLTAQKAAYLLQQEGENRLHETQKNSVAAMFFSQFKDVMIFILAVATLVSAAMGETAEAVAIITIVLLNALMGFFQEFRTEQTLEALKKMNAPTARVIRDSAEQVVAAHTVVPGDLLVLEAGDKISADAKVIKSNSFSCDEAMLTGESMPVQKAVSNELYMGCIALTGRAYATVTKTGMKTKMGEIAGLVNEAQEAPTPLQIKLQQLGKFLAIACFIICIAVAGLGVLQGNAFLDMLLTGVSLAVAAIPEGLPAIVTITLALSMGRILRRGAVIRRLHAVETLGCAGVICTDKTGTVTQNKMTVKKIWVPGHTFDVSGDGYALKGAITEHQKPDAGQTLDKMNDLLQCGVLCATATIRRKQSSFSVTGDPTEIAVMIAAAKAGVEKQVLLRTWHICDENPFDSVRKRMSVVVSHSNGEKKLFCKGAPDILLSCCTHIQDEKGYRLLTQNERAQIQAATDEMAKKALRVLAFAQSKTPEKGEKELCFLGLMGMIDPPRPEVHSAVKKCRKAGIRPVMITGDAPETAYAIAQSVEIAQPGESMLTGAELEKMSDEQLRNVCMKTAVYARVSPKHKLRIVRAYQACNQVTAMTGDGVNDSPAIKEADIGVAMGITGTDVTKEASSVVLLDDNFATIVSAVEEGRVIYQNIRRFVRFLLTSNLGEVTGMLLGMLLQLPVMLLPIQILLVNLFTDGLPAIALGLEPPAKDIMQEKPRPKNEGLFAHGLGAVIAVRGILLGVCSCIAYAIVLHQSGDIVMARSACFLTVVLSQMLHIFECRGKGVSFGANPWLLAAVACSIGFTVLSIYLPQAQQLFSTCALDQPSLFVALGASFVGPILSWIVGVTKIFSTKEPS